MLENILDFASKIDDILLGPWTMVFIASAAVYLSIRSGFFQVRKLRFILKNTLGKTSEKTEAKQKGRMTPFQATTTALASTVGMGNMAGKKGDCPLFIKLNGDRS